MADIAIVGAGLAGRCLALLLAKDHRVTLFEKGALSDSNSTGRVAAAMVAPNAESVTCSEHTVTMGLWSARHWPALLSALHVKTQYQNTGSIILAHRQDLTELQHFQRRLKAPQGGRNLAREQLLQLEPELENDFAQALYLPSEGHLDNGLFYDELQVAIVTHPDIRLREHCEVTVCDDQVEVAGQPRQFDWVLDCRGTGVKKQVLTPDLPVRGVRGEVLRLFAPEVNLSRPVRLMHPRYPLYIVPKSNHQYVVGATEIESEHRGDMTVRSSLELLSAAYSVHKGFAEAEIQSMDVGFRPAYADNEARINVSNKLIQINGLYRHGYLVTPYVLTQVLNILQTYQLAVSGFAPEDTRVDAQLVSVLSE